MIFFQCDCLEELDNIIYPATQYESKEWDINTVKDHAVKPISSDYEYIYGYDYSLGDGITRASADMDIDAGHVERKRYI